MIVYMGGRNLHRFTAYVVEGLKLLYLFTSSTSTVILSFWVQYMVDRYLSSFQQNPAVGDRRALHGACMDDVGAMLVR